MRRQLETMDSVGSDVGSEAALDAEDHVAAQTVADLKLETAGMAEADSLKHSRMVEKVARQLNIELEQAQQAAERYRKVLADLQKFGRATQLQPEQKLLLSWYTPLSAAIEREQKRVQKRVSGYDRRVYGPYLMLLDADRLAVITLNHVLSCVLLSEHGHSVINTAQEIGRAICGEVVNEQYKRDKGKKRALRRQYYQEVLGFGAARPDAPGVIDDEDDTKYVKKGAKPLGPDDAPPSRSLFPKEEQYLQRAFQKEWSPSVCAKVGAYCLQELIDTATFSLTPTPGGGARVRAAEPGLDAPDESGDVMGPRSAAALARAGSDPFNAGGSGTDVPLTNAFAHIYEYTGRGSKLKKKFAKAGMVIVHPKVRELLASEHTMRGLMSTRALPMIVPPLPWKHIGRGGYIRGRERVMRVKGSEMQLSSLRLAGTKRGVQGLREDADGNALDPIFEALNYLGRTAWRINGDLLPIMQAIQDEAKGEAEMPMKGDVEIPEFDESEKYKTVRKAMARAQRKAERKNAENHALRCDHELKMDIARSLQHESEIYFPYNLDFRGRVYPMPPNLNHLGSDICRGLLSFARTRPLGERGLHWLKVHLSNLMGNDKCSFDERREYTEAALDEVFDSADNPLHGKRWWLGADSPWQALAACKELAAALRSPDPHLFESSLPVHQDGSCNGLQHYAALGRDLEGGTAVNLIKADVPGDVYSRIKDKVVAIVEKDAAAAAAAPAAAAAAEAGFDFDADTTGDEAEVRAKAEAAERRLQRIAVALCSNGGLISRKVVKQTVMTSVYGVTFVGARKQIGNRLRELADDGDLVGLDEDDLYHASCYLANLTLGAIDEMFDGANRVKDWLTSCAREVAAMGQPLTWITPMGLPVVQPYRKPDRYIVHTVMQKVTIADQSDECPVNSSRQTSAFPPNYVHSLDSTHMMMTALECEKVGMTFTAVHDSFWTHAADIDEMNDKLRSAFVELHEQPLLDELRETLKLQYPSMDIAPVPARGKLDLNTVKDSPYFFN